MKMVWALMLGGALVYGAFLAVARRRLPDLTSRTGWRARFLAASTIFAVSIGGWIYPEYAAYRNRADAITCYEGTAFTALDDAKPEDAKGVAWRGSEAGHFLRSVATAWQALTSADGEEDWRLLDYQADGDALPARIRALRQHLSRAIEDREMTAREARLFEAVYRRAAYHHFRGRSERGMRATCYDMSRDMAMLMRSTEHLFVRLEALRETRAKGGLDEATARDVLRELAYSVEAVRLLEERWPEPKAPETFYRAPEEQDAVQRTFLWPRSGDSGWRGMVDLVDNGAFDEATQKVAEWILRLEGVRPPGPPPPAPDRPAEPLPDHDTVMKALEAKFAGEGATPTPQ